MTPKHIRSVEKNRQAIAPYNFVELPDKTIAVDSSVSHDRYYDNKYSGNIECLLTTSSPLYIRCNTSAQDFQEGKESKQLVDFYYTNPVTKEPVLPGSSLRGMFRSLIEIISYSKLSKISDQQRFFFRAVAAPKDDPLGGLYKSIFRKHPVKAGYLRYQNGNWFIQPAKLIEESPFVWVKDSLVSQSINGFISLRDNHYLPQHISDVYFEDIYTNNSRKFAGSISISAEYEYSGTLITSGNMVESNQNAANTKRRNHCLVREIDTTAKPIKINEDAIWHYREALTTFQSQDPPFDSNHGALEEDRCIFYCEPSARGKEINFFGHSPNFRIPYLLKDQGTSSSAKDFIPTELRDSNSIDFAESIFGCVAGKESEKKVAIASRIFFSDGICQEIDLNDVFMTGIGGKVPKILASPKPTTFQHYLVQDGSVRKDLKHYGSKPIEETVIRGHKLYWHKGQNPDIWHLDPQNVSETQSTRIRPVKAGKSFKFDIKFENLSSVELGALLWILDIATQDKYRFSLGMGKPLGMGAVKIQHKVNLCDRKQRYENLFSQTHTWVTGYGNELTADSITEHIGNFEEHILTQLNEINKQKLRHLSRIKTLLTMLEWKDMLSEEEMNQRRYMEIERDRNNADVLGVPVKPSDSTVNEYSDRRVLPSPMQIRLKLSQHPAWAVGMKVQATVLQKRETGSLVTYAIEDTVVKQKEGKFKKIPEHGLVIVEITKLKDDGTIKKVKFYKATE